MKLERAGVEELTRSGSWLVGAEWRLEDGLCLDAIVRAHGYDYELRITFPALYPEAPSVVRPRNTEARISTHQYGDANGPLCLEWGPDNWHQGVTAVQMLQSAYKLFETENPLGQNRPAIPVTALSRHALTIGQELRTEWARWFLGVGLQDYLRERPAPSVGTFKFSLRKTGENWTCLIHEVKPLGDAAWKDTEIPTALPNTDEKSQDTGVWFKTELDGSTLRGLSKLSDLQSILKPWGGPVFLAADGSSPAEGYKPALAGALVIDRAGEFHLFGILSASLFTCGTIRAERTPTEIRSPDGQCLSGKKIGIVGLGSAGSKIAVSLARMGVRKFYLVDHDILVPENLQRHALDWLAVTQHKVDAVSSAINRIASGIEIEACRYHLSGQESNAGVSGALDKLAYCDLIIDATAEAKVFNLLGSVARTANRPMIWLEVYGGGIGGMIARSRPHVDPSPQAMRQAYLQYCTDHPDTRTAAGNRYGIETDVGTVLIATDADISVIAHHASRFVADCFSAAEDSRFPYSMYLVGLANGWVFEEPFVTIPISMASISTAGWSAVDDNELDPEIAEFLVQLIEKKQNATANTIGNSVAPG